MLECVPGQLAWLSTRRSTSTMTVAPQAYGIPYRGGKPDDITVLVSYVSKAGDTTQPDASNGAEPMPDEFERPQSKL